MKVIDRQYECKNFQYEGHFAASRKMVSPFKIGVALNRLPGKPPTLSVQYDIKGSGHDGSNMEFLLESTSYLDFEYIRPDAEELYKELELVADDAYKILIMEVTGLGKSTYPNKPTLNKEGLLSILQSEIEELYPLGGS